MKTVTETLALPVNPTDSAAIADIFAEGTTPDAKYFFKSIRCLVNTVTRLVKDEKNFHPVTFDPDTATLLVHKVTRTIDGKAKTEWGFSIGENLYFTYLSKEYNKSTIKPGVDSDATIFTGSWPELKAFLSQKKKDEKPVEQKTEEPKTEEEAPKADTPVDEPTPVVEQADNAETPKADAETVASPCWIRHPFAEYWDADESKTETEDN